MPPELPSVFTAEEHEPMSDFSIMPNGWYLGQVSKSEIKKTKAGTGLRLNMQVVIEESKDDGEKYKGRIVFIGLNIQNPNPKAVEISQRELKSLCDSVNIQELEDSDELHDILFGFKLGVEKSEGYDDKNVIKKYVPEKEYNEITE